MEDKFEKFVGRNRDEFDIHLPGPSVWENIQKRQSKTLFFSGKKMLRIAYRVASVAIIFVLSYAYHDFRTQNKPEKISARMNNKIYKEIPELKETEMYYNKQVDLKLKELKPLLKDQPEIEKIVKNDLTELDQVYASLKQDLNDNIANEKVLEAMIQNYRLKLQILEDLLSEVKNYENYENASRNYDL